jgi:adenylate kinase family enzyme
MKARAKKIAEHEKYAVDAFKNHVIRQDLNQGLFRSWRCGAPDDSNHHFHVTTTPGRIFVAGDNGTMVWERNPDMIPWVRGSIHSIDYFASKVPNEIPVEEWDVDVAREWVQDQILEENEERDEDNEEGTNERISKYQELLEILSDDEVYEHEFYRALSDSGLNDGCDWPDFTNYTSNFLWCREDLKWFLANLPAEVAAT